MLQSRSRSRSEGAAPSRSLGSDFLGGSPAEGTPGHVSGFLGGVVADEPRAALVAREVLSRGGNAADAAVALGFALAVTLPSRAGLGGGGACLAYSPAANSVNGGVPEAIAVHAAGARARRGGRRTGPAAVPMLARGLFALHARYGRRPFETLIAPAEQMARFGVPRLARLRARPRTWSPGRCSPTRTPAPCSPTTARRSPRATS